MIGRVRRADRHAAIDRAGDVPRHQCIPQQLDANFSFVSTQSAVCGHHHGHATAARPAKSHVVEQVPMPVKMDQVDRWTPLDQCLQHLCGIGGEKQLVRIGEAVGEVAGRPNHHPVVLADPRQRDPCIRAKHIGGQYRYLLTELYERPRQTIDHARDATECPRRRKIRRDLEDVERHEGENQAREPMAAPQIATHLRCLNGHWPLLQHRASITLLSRP